MSYTCSSLSYIQAFDLSDGRKRISGARKRRRRPKVLNRGTAFRSRRGQQRFCCVFHLPQKVRFGASDVCYSLRLHRRHQQVGRRHQRSFSGASAAPAAGELQPHSGRDDGGGNILLFSFASAAAAGSVACFICAERSQPRPTAGDGGYTELNVAGKTVSKFSSSLVFI